METEKIRNLTAEELVQQEKDSMDQLFRLKFQMKMGQTESLNKVRGLRKDIARMKTIARQRELGESSPKVKIKTRAKTQAKTQAKSKAQAKTRAQASVKRKAKTAARPAAKAARKAGKKSAKHAKKSEKK
jgi:large subunit ribosomal protein L29